jgi:hypothetical protein
MKYKSCISLFFLLLGGCSSGVQTDRPYQEIGRAEHFTLIEPGYVIGIEKKEIENHGKTLNGIQNAKIPYSLKFHAEGESNQELKEEFSDVTTGQLKVMVVTQVVKSVKSGGDTYNKYLYNAYKNNLNGAPDFSGAFVQLDLMFDDFKAQLKHADELNEPFTHVLVMSMGWNNDQAESLRRYNKILENLQIESKKSETVKFKPLVIAFTWPSVWGGVTDSALLRTGRHLISYANKANDADEVGYTWANWVVNNKIPNAIDLAAMKSRPKLVLIGHSFGARVLSRAMFSANFIESSSPHKSTVDVFLGLQGAFSARRFVKSEGLEGAPYAGLHELPTKIVLTSSENDEANWAALWSSHIGGPQGLSYANKKSDIFNVHEWTENDNLFSEANGFSAGKILTINATSIVKDQESNGVDAHNDILDDEMGRLIWKAIR